jgi:hypothetical protein
MPELIDYAVPGRLTDLRGVPAAALPPSTDPPTLHGIARGLVVTPQEARALGLPPVRFATERVRSAADLVRALLALDAAPLAVARPPELRVVGPGRHAAVLTVALLRHHRVAARARCGFASSAGPGHGTPCWVVEHRASPAVPWERAGRPGEGFLTGGEAWVAYRRGATPDDVGPGEIKAAAIRDLAALNRVEVLPSDEWGRMHDAVAGRTGPEHDALVDAVAAVCGADAPAFLADLYAREELRVPEHLLR